MIKVFLFCKQSQHKLMLNTLSKLSCFYSLEIHSSEKTSDLIKLSESINFDLILVYTHHPDISPVALEKMNQFQEFLKHSFAIIISSLNQEEISITMQICKTYSFDFFITEPKNHLVLKKESLFGQEESEFLALVEKITEIISQSQLISQNPTLNSHQESIPTQETLDSFIQSLPPLDCIGLAISTRASSFLTQIIPQIRSLNIPIIIVHHIQIPFIENFIHRLNSITSVPIEILKDNTRIDRNIVYISSQFQNLRIKKQDSVLTASYLKDKLQFPSFDIFFQSFKEENISVLPILMNSRNLDGMKGLKILKENNTETVVQDPKECTNPTTSQHLIKTKISSIVLKGSKIKDMINLLKTK